MKIARIIYDWPPPWDGLSPAPYETTKSQEKLGHTFDVFCGRWPKAGDLETLDNVVFHPTWRAPLHGTIALTSSVIMFIKYLLWRKKNSVDLIHSHGHFGIWLYLYRGFLEKYFPWANELKSPLVVSFHNTVAGRKKKLEDSGSTINNISKYLDWPLAEISDRLAVKVASACIFVSEETKQEAIKHYKADREKCFVVESGVNTNEFKPVSIDERAKTRIELGLEPTDKVLLFVGVLTERKNPHLIIEALAKLPKDYKLILVGSGSGTYKENLEQKIRDLHLKDRIVRVGYTPYPQIPIAYQASNLFVLPSTFEGMPKVVMEALACGVPVLGSGFKIDGDVKGVTYLNDTSVEELYSKIKQLIVDKPEMDLYHFAQRFSWDAKALEIEKIYEHVKATYLQ